MTCEESRYSVAEIKRARRLEKALSHTKRSGDCLVWQGFCQKPHDKKPEYHYPEMHYMGKRWRGNRLVLFLSTGKIPSGMLALHRCNNTKCVNPDHLYWGTQKDNTRDALNAGNHVCGSDHLGSKLNEEKVVMIKSMSKDGVSAREIAKFYGVHSSTIDRIVLRKSWKHVVEGKK